MPVQSVKSEIFLKNTVINHQVLQSILCINYLSKNSKISKLKTKDFIKNLPYTTYNL